MSPRVRLRGSRWARRHRHVARRRRGFILAATLWGLVALAALAAYMDQATDAHVDNARRAKLLLQAEIDRRSTEATVLYLLATNRVNFRGLVLAREQEFVDPDAPIPLDFGDGELRFGGQPYAGLGGVVFSLQDESGLVSVNTPDDPALHLVLRYLGASDDAVARLIPRLRDYVDRDHDLGLDGAERYDYQRIGRPPPTNWFLASPNELNRVLGADQLLPPAAWRRLRAMSTPRLVAGRNFNTMPVEVVAALLGGIRLDALGPFLEARAAAPIASLDQIGDLTGQHPLLGADALVPLPTPFVRLLTWWPEGGRRTVLGITLSPAAETAPWRREYGYSEPVHTDTGTPTMTTTELLGGRPPEDT